MAFIVPLPPSIRAKLELGQNSHPGLLLDKFVPSYDPNASPGKLSELVQKPTVEAVAKLSMQPPPGLDFSGLLKRRSDMLDALAANRFLARTSGPLTLHLARASALENAGISLHPLYGFTYIPGSGLKGMARAFAETVWKPTQPDKSFAQDKIEQVFGNQPGEPRQEFQRAGFIIFHDAWPESWPRLLVDIVNCHHPKYYGAKPDDNENAPGDWENPVPVYFLAVQPATTFSFALSKRRECPPGDAGILPASVGLVSQPALLLSLAQDWLLGALTHLGAGAKTAAGYGCFQLLEDAEPARQTAARVRKIWTGALDPDLAVRAEFTTTLELVTPAFLAGADQKDPSGCDLRPATLRGLLRWWWRTLHAGHLDVATLRRLESALWGNTESGGAVRICVEPNLSLPRSPIPCPGKKVGMNMKGKEILIPDDSFTQKNEIVKAQAMTTQALFYASYGMDEMKTGDLQSRRQRFCVFPGAKWRVSLSARKGTYDERDSRGRVVRSEPISAIKALEQAKASLWLFCYFGGAGSKSRKGFGSFEDIQGMSLPACKAAAKTFRTACGLDVPKAPEEPESPAIDLAETLTLEIGTSWKNCWFALDQLAAAAQSFAQAHKASGHGKHCKTKLALGLPRKIHGPLSFALPRQKDWNPPEDLVGPKGDRHASPVHYHVAKDPASGNLIIRVIAFPARYLPDTATSRSFLGMLLVHLKTDLEKRVKEHATKGQKSVTAGPASSIASRSQPPPSLPQASTRVEAILLEEKTNKGGWKARHDPCGLSGPIQNTSDVPPDKKPGDKVQLLVASCNPTSIAFRWPTAADEERLKNQSARGAPGHRTPPPGRGGFQRKR
ncbi:MAG: type III-B CRISPR module RAMP protein Cmr6 [Planctomycetes bacterium]|nr:type III-B CRISPR module RAMP protein Cmr6 [Planctomycetota bacterium]